MTLDPRDKLLKNGDMLEQRMFSDEDFANTFSIYPLIWTKYVESNRERDQIWLTSEEWMRFAERHYTAIVRCWNARSAKEKIRATCENAIDSANAIDMLTLHELLITYFCSVRAAIDNLQHAYECDPIKSPAEFDKIAKKVGTHANLRWLYERGTQFVHKAVVPCLSRDGILTFDVSFFDDTETKWDEQRTVQFHSVTDVIDNQWRYFVDGMHAAWCRLLELLKACVPSSRVPKAVLPPAPRKLNLTPASDDRLHGWPSCGGSVSGVYPRDFRDEGGID